ncbi:MAG: GHKL domain-containing protein [Oscillospiraceae bacterium]|nr:GHKL domain-containing protein [Oscillospiraceae bacterium]
MAVYLSTVWRVLQTNVLWFSGAFYQSFLIPLALAALVLGYDSLGRQALLRLAGKMLGTCLVGAVAYSFMLPMVSGFTAVGVATHLLLTGLIILFAAVLSPQPAHIRIVMASAVVAEINWAQSISSLIFMPLMSLTWVNICQFLLLAAALAVIVLFRPDGSARMPAAYWLSMLVIAVISVACLFAVRILSGHSNFSLGQDVVLSIILPAFFVVNLMIYYLYHVLVKEHRRASEMAAMQTRFEQDQEFYQRTEALYREYQSLRHELKNHFSVMETFLREGQYDQLQQYFKDFAGRSLPLLEEFRCPNGVITSVIAHQAAAAKAAGVRLDVIAAVPERIGIADEDLCSLLSNMLDNSVEGCVRAGGSQVRATLHTEKGCLFISVKNPVAEDVTAGNLTTTKKNPAAHGFGIPIIRRIAEKYDGFVTFRVDGGYFTTDAMLYMEEEP